MKACHLCLLACLAAVLLGGTTAQLDGLLGAVGGAVGGALSDPARLQKCDQYQQANRDKEAACTQAGAQPNAWSAGCPEACKRFWADLPKECKEIVDSLGIISPIDASGKPMKASEFFDKVCAQV